VFLLVKNPETNAAMTAENEAMVVKTAGVFLVETCYGAVYAAC
jgi:hypothetical protein